MFEIALGSVPETRMALSSAYNNNLHYMPIPSKSLIFETAAKRLDKISLSELTIILFTIITDQYIKSHFSSFKMQKN